MVVAATNWKHVKLPFIYTMRNRNLFRKVVVLALAIAAFCTALAYVAQGTTGFCANVPPDGETLSSSIGFVPTGTAAPTGAWQLGRYRGQLASDRFARRQLPTQRGDVAVELLPHGA